MRFQPLPRGSGAPSSGMSIAYLVIDFWNDYSFVTMFRVYLFDGQGVRHDLGDVKIGFKGQTIETATYSTIGDGFDELPANYFSVGTDLDYYLTLSRGVPAETRVAYLAAMRDVAGDQTALATALEERVFQTSLLRSLNLVTITDQYRRVLAGGVPLTDYTFRFTQDPGPRLAGYELDFEVKASSTPSTNIHAIIGRNGVGKTTLLNNMTMAVKSPGQAGYRFETLDWIGDQQPIARDYFSSVVSVSFSAFDPFNPPQEQPDPSLGTCYFYVGLKSYADEGGALLKSQTELADEFVASLSICLSEHARGERWKEAIQNLESDDNFAEMELSQLWPLRDSALDERARSLLKRMSSGHAIVLLTITKLVARVEEKTLVLFDEPESHLHPPLLSALIRSLSRLLTNRNAIAILATHSPVVLQEIPRSCVWKITRSGLASEARRPEIETFGENVGMLTRETFGLEVSKSGFNALLSSEADRWDNYDQVLASFGGQLGFEGRAILRSLMHRAGKSGR